MREYSILIGVLNFLSTFIPLLILIAFVTLLERKVMGSMQKRRGPNVIGYFGLLQPIADGLKLVIKEPIFPYKSNRVLFMIAPPLTFIVSLCNLIFLPLNEFRIIGEFQYDLLCIFGISSFGIYGIILSGWASNSKYAFLGALRAAAQMISYELLTILVILPIIAYTRSMNLQQIVEAQKPLWLAFILFPLAICYFICILAETNRTPFDLPEAEGELVAGYNVEYSAFYFAFFYLGEYLNIIFMSILFTLLFLGGWHIGAAKSIIFFAVKIYAIIYTIIWIRATVPRYRFDQLMQIGWKVLLPFTMGFLILSIGIIMNLSIIKEGIMENAIL